MFFNSAKSNGPASPEVALERKYKSIKFVVEDGDTVCSMCNGCISKGMIAYFLDRDNYCHSIDERNVSHGYHFHELCYQIKEVRKDYQIVDDSSVLKSVSTTISTRGGK